MNILPWEKVGEPAILAKSFGRRLVTQKFKDPYTGEIAEYSQFAGTPFSCIVMGITKNNEVLGVRQFRHPTGRVMLELPGGNPKTPEQTPEETAKEELLEESFGCVAGRIIKLNPEPLWIDPSCFAFHYHAFLFLDCVQSNEKGNLDKGEYIELVKTPLKDWIEQCENGQITDSKSVVATTLAMKHLVLL